ncbi:MAG TPA: cyclic nucleotide-binding domain-containing protein [Chloroflexota bacterium]|nr:cyclic nucleotide-binding domain-containing protein [Chloroflexota bacterium]
MRTHEHEVAEQAFLRGLSARHLAQIAEYVSDVRFPAGEFVFREGEEAGLFYIITRGRIALEIYGPGRGPIPIATLHEGDALGWSWLFPPYRWHFDARTLEASAALAFDAPRLRALCDADHDLGYDLMQRFAQTITQRLQATRMQLLDVYGDHTGSRSRQLRNGGVRHGD